MPSLVRDAVPVAGRGLQSRQSAQAPPRWFPVRGEVASSRSRAFGLLGALLLLASYGWLSHRAWVSSALLPPLGSVLQTGWQTLQEADFWLDLKVSFLRVTAGFLAAALLAVPLGILAGSFRLAS